MVKALSFARPPSGGASMLFRGRIKRMNRNKISEALTLTCDVVPDNADICGSDLGVITDVPILQAGFGNISTDTVTSATGMIYIPEEGSRVLVAFDGTSHVVVGYYTGPARTVDAVISSSEDYGTTVSYNPGIESTTNRVGAPTIGDEKDWLFGANPGDCIMGKGLARVKVTSDAVVAGTSPSNIIILKSNDERLERCKELDVRMIGYQKSHRAVFGLESAAAAHLLRPQSMPAPQAGCITTEIFEATPYAFARKAMLVKQRGHVTAGIMDDARQSLLGGIGLVDIMTEELSRQFTIERDAVIQPLPIARIGSIPMMELLFDHIETYDRQVRSDGSWFVRAGNISNTPAPGQRFASATGTLDMNMSYDALTGKYTVCAGKKGVPLATLTIDGTTGSLKLATLPATFEVSLTGIDAKAPLVSITALASVDVKAPSVSITGAVNITGPTTVTGPLTVSGPITGAATITAGAAITAGALISTPGDVIAGLGTAKPSSLIYQIL